MPSGALIKSATAKTRVNKRCSAAVGTTRSANIVAAPTKNTSTTPSRVVENHHSVSGSAHFRSFVPS